MTATTAVVVTHNSAGEIGATLRALREADLPIVVVDNASDDGTAAIVRRDFPEVDLVANGANTGFARAVNQGLARRPCEIALLVNPDCTLPPETAHGLVRFLADRPDAAIAGPRIVSPEGRVAVSAHPFETVTSVVLSRFGGSLVPVWVRRALSGPARRRTYDACRVPAGPTAVDWLSGACLAVRADLLADTGGLDERYFLYYEDEELCWQSRERGRAVFYVPELTATHIGGASSEVGATWPHLYRSMLLFFALHRRSSYQAVRAAVFVRAGVGLTTATARRLTRAPSGPARARAWRQVAQIAWAGRLDASAGASEMRFDP